MNVASATNRRRHSLPIHQRRKRPRSSLTRPSAASDPLSGVVACLSGQTASDKTHLEALIATLGGVAVRDFDPAYVTHLILDEAKGSKYEYVKRNKEREFAKRLKVVKSEWVIDCDREGSRIDESLYAIDETVEEEKSTGNNELPKEIQNASLDEACDWMLQQSFPRLYTAQSFLLVGFDINERSLESTSLSKLIRRAGGTIYWSPNDAISVVVLSDDCSEEQWEDVRSFCQQHPRGPMAVTADWILSSLHSQTIRAPPFPPQPRKITQQPVETKSNNVADSRLPDVAAKKVLLNSNVFHGDIFAIVRPKPHDGTVSFEKAEMESLISSNGGLLLSKQLYEAIKIDIQAALKNNSTISRNFYVVSSGGYGDLTKLNPLLADLSKLGVKIVSVSPIWVKGCIGDEIKYTADECPMLFQPQPWPIRLLPPNNFLVSLTGFVDASRYGIIWMLREIGAEYTDNLKSKNTHLICKDASGKKYEKACEWGLHVISVDWLYHVVRYGYRDGCERHFSLVKGEKEVSLLPNNDWDAPSMPKPVSNKLSNKYNDSKDHVDPDVPTIETTTETIRHDIKEVKKECTEPRKPPHSVDKQPKYELPSPVTSTISDVKHDNKASSYAKDANSLHDATTSVLDEAKSLGPPNSSKQHDIDPKQDTTDSKSPNDVNKRLHSALQSLETSNTNKPAFQRRSKRQRQQPIKSPDKSPSLLTQHSPEEEYPQTEAFTVAVRADACLTSGSHDSVPQSQVDDAEDNGESQVVWFAERGR